MVEFALVLPVMMLLLLIALDFGRVFLGWVELNNAARVAANFAAQNPTAWGTPGSPSDVAEYARQVTGDASAIDCTLPATIPAPTFPAGTDVGSPAQVNLTCQFSLITPFIGNILGNPISVGASAAFPIRAGAIEGIPAGSIAPTPVASPSASPSSSSSPSASPSPSATPVPMCIVPNLVGKNVNQATAAWGPGQGNNPGAGFELPISFQPLVPPNYSVGHQNLSVGAPLPCDSTVITVTP